jgi:hypothetical protein
MEEENKATEDLQDIAFPIATIPSFSRPTKPAENPAAIKKIIRGAIQGAFQKRTPSDYDYKYHKDAMPYVSEEDTQLVIHLIESLQPADVIEAALASQFAISYIQGLKHAIDHSQKMLELFSFGHQVLDTLQKFRSKGAQQIQVNYNHNQGQINNIKINEKESQHPIIEAS